MQGLVNIRKAPGGLCEVLKPQVDYFHSKLTLNEMIYLDRELLSVCPRLNAMHESPWGHGPWQSHSLLSIPQACKRFCAGQREDVQTKENQSHPQCSSLLQAASSGHCSVGTVGSQATSKAASGKKLIHVQKNQIAFLVLPSGCVTSEASQSSLWAAVPLALQGRSALPSLFTSQCCPKLQKAGRASSFFLIISK